MLCLIPTQYIRVNISFHKILIDMINVNNVFIWLHVQWRLYRLQLRTAPCQHCLRRFYDALNIILAETAFVKPFSLEAK